MIESVQDFDETKIGSEQFYQVYLKLCQKYFFLISAINGERYQKNLLNVDGLIEIFAKFAFAAASSLPSFPDNKILVETSIEDMKELHRAKFKESQKK